MRQGFCVSAASVRGGADPLRNRRQKTGVLVRVLPMEKLMSQAVAQMAKTIHSSRWMIGRTRTLPSVGEHDVAAAVTVPSHHLRRGCPRRGLLSEETPEP
jgi:hypothetical protein